MNQSGIPQGQVVIQKAMVKERIEAYLDNYSRIFPSMVPVAIGLGPAEYGSFVYLELPEIRTVLLAPEVKVDPTFRNLPIFCTEMDGVFIMFKDDGMRNFISWREQMRASHAPTPPGPHGPNGKTIEVM
jgi:hypothetical protein